MERRRIERDLHDGAQQHLIALKVKVGLLAAMIPKDADQALILASELKDGTEEALETLRDLARGIYPPLLAERGLGPALEAHARKAMLPVTVEADGVSRYPQQVEAAVYFCCLEALQNVQKYAGARQVSVRLHLEDGGIRFEVEDDGHGFDPATAKKGAGLTNMADRLDALGGKFEVRSSIGHGTTVNQSAGIQPGGLGPAS